MIKMFEKSPKTNVLPILLLMFFVSETNQVSTCLRQSNNCLSCSNSLVCSSCQSGYYLQGGFQCSQIVGKSYSGCSQLNSNYQCITCFSGYIYDPTNMKCLPCTVTNCGQCSLSDPTICTQCSSGYGLMPNNTCLACAVAYCYSCDNDVSVCPACPALTQGYTNSTSSCLKCEDSHCITCPADRTTCTACSVGYGVEQTHHKYCPSCSVLNCYKCSLNANICTQCKQTYVLSGNTCVACPSDCYSCTSGTVCTICMYYYMLNASLCTANPSGNGGCVILGTYITGQGYRCNFCWSPYTINPTPFTNSQGACTTDAATVSYCTQYSSIQYNYCLQCNTNLINGGPSLDGLSCISCSGNCTICTTNYQICTTCTDGYGFNSSGDCVLCGGKYCSQCYADYLICTVCNTIDALLTDGVCVMCVQDQCKTCNLTDRAQCIQCFPWYGLVNGVYGICVACQVQYCYWCFVNPLTCQACSGQYRGVDRSANLNNTCIPCKITYCYICWQEAATCRSCEAGYGLNMTLNTSRTDLYGVRFALECVACAQLCATCNGTNYLQCLTCIPGYYITLSTFTCAPYPCDYGCILCTSSYSTCLSCIPFRYNQAPGARSACSDNPEGCHIAYQNTAISHVECSKCVQYYQLQTYSGVTLCYDICGDSYTINWDCDFSRGVAFDGCEDNCTVSDNFTCDKHNYESVCSYTGNLTITLLKIQHQEQLSNSYTFYFTLLPPLDVFRTSTNDQMNVVFDILSSDFVFESFGYLYSENTLVVNAKQTQELTDKIININFIPNYNITEQYINSTNQSFSFKLTQTEQTNFIYYSTSAITFGKLLFYFCCILSAFCVLQLILSTLLSHSAGIETLFVIQFSWIIFLRVDSFFILQYASFLPLKLFFNLKLVNDDKSDISKVSFSSSTSDNSYQNETSNPFYSQFGISSTTFLNNFNCALIILFVFFIVTVISKILQVRKKKQLRSSIELNDEQKMLKIEKSEKSYNFAFTCLISVMLSSFLYFIMVTEFMIKSKTLISNIQNIIFVCFVFIVYVSIFVVFYKNMHRTVSLSTSTFKQDQLSLHHFFIQIFTLILAYSVLIFVDLSYLALIPFLIIILYTLIKKPYLQLRETLRSVFNYFVMCLFVCLKFYLERTKINNIETFNMNLTTILLFCSAFLLLIVQIIGFFAIIYSHYLKLLLEKNKSIKSQIEIEKDQVLKKLVKQDLTMRLKNLNDQDIFKNIFDPSSNILNISNYIKQNNLKDFNKGEPNANAIKMMNNIKQTLLNQKNVTKYTKRQETNSYQTDEIVWNENKLQQIQASQAKLQNKNKQHEAKNVLQETKEKKKMQINTLNIREPVGQVLGQQNNFIRYKATNKQVINMMNNKSTNVFLDSYNQIP